MPRVEESISIGRPAEDVFAYVTDPANDPVWQSGVVESELIGGGESRVGSRIRVVRRFLGRRMEFVGEVTRWEPPNRAEVKSVEGPFRFDGSYQCEPEDGGCRLTVAGELGSFGGFFGKLADPVVTQMGVRQLRADLENLKDILESRSEGDAQASA